MLADDDTRVAIVSAPFIAFPEVLIKMVAEQVDNGIRLTADFPTLSGEPGGSSMS